MVSVHPLMYIHICFTVNMVSVAPRLSVHNPMIYTRKHKTGNIRLSGSHVNPEYGYINTTNHTNAITSTDTSLHLIIYSYTWGSTHPIVVYLPHIQLE